MGPINPAVADFPCNGRGRYVFIVVNGFTMLTLCEVEITGMICPSSCSPSLVNNLARACNGAGETSVPCPAFQSSLYPGGDASNANDGITSTDWSQTSRCTHTEAFSPLWGSDGPWWYVDLQRSVIITSVRVFNRHRFETRLDGFSILVGNSTDWHECTACAVNLPGPNDPDFVEIDCNGHGRYVHIVLPRFGILTLCEVEITGYASCAVELPWAQSLSPSSSSFSSPASSHSLGSSLSSSSSNPLSCQVVNNLATHCEGGQCPTYQSSTEPGGLSLHANDEKTSGTCSSTEVTAHGNGEDNPWWYVDLQCDAHVESVRVYNREGFENSLDDFSIYVGNTSDWRVLKPCASHLAAPVFPLFLDYECLGYGRYLIIVINRFSILTLCEVEVTGRIGCENTVRSIFVCERTLIHTCLILCVFVCV